MFSILKHRGLVRWLLVATIGCAIVSGCTSNQPVKSNLSDNSIPRAFNGKPDLSGLWQSLNTANWNLEAHTSYGGPQELGAIGATPPGIGVVVGGNIPYQSWAKSKKEQNFSVRHQEDPEAKCFLPGVPRATYLPLPFQILQGTGKIMIVYGFAEANRTIHMDKENPEPPPIDSWMGRSHGRWEGDTLVVDASGFNGQAWLDRAGNFASAGLTVQERYTIKDENRIDYEATLTDPSVYDKPWKIRMPLYRRLDDGARLLEFKCVEYSEELLYGHLRRGAAKS